MKSLHSLFATALLCASLLTPAAHGQDAATDVGFIAGTEGAGVEVAQGFSRFLRGRLSASGFSASETFTTDQVRYEGDADLLSAALVLDIAPFGGSFHLSAGLVFQDHDIRGTAPVEDFAVREFGQENIDLIRRTLGDVDFGTLEGTAELDSVAPYAGLGFRSSRTSSGIGFAFDLGVIFFGEPDVEVTARTSLPISLIPNGNELLNEFLEQEERELQEEVDDYEVFPVVRFSIFYRF